MGLGQRDLCFVTSLQHNDRSGSDSESLWVIERETQLDFQEFAAKSSSELQSEQLRFLEASEEA